MFTRFFPAGPQLYQEAGLSRMSWLTEAAGPIGAISCMPPHDIDLISCNAQLGNDYAERTPRTARCYYAGLTRDARGPVPVPTSSCMSTVPTANEPGWPRCLVLSCKRRRLPGLPHLPQATTTYVPVWMIARLHEPGLAVDGMRSRHRLETAIGTSPGQALRVFHVRLVVRATGTSTSRTWPGTRLPLRSAVPAAGAH